MRYKQILAIKRSSDRLGRYFVELHLGTFSEKLSHRKYNLFTTIKSRGFQRGQTDKKNLPMRVAAADLVYSLKMRQLFYSCKKVIGSIDVFTPIVPFEPVLRVTSRWPIVPNLTKQIRNSKGCTYHTLLR